MNLNAITPLTCLFAVVLAAPLCAAETPWIAPARAAAKKNPVPSSPAALEAGKTVFEKECLSCHGPSGKGDGPKSAQLKVPPHDLSAPQVTGQSDGALFWKLTAGKNPMPKFDELLTEEQRWQVINYMRSFAAPSAVVKTPTEPSK